MKLPQKYSAARKALAACVKIDEVKSMRDKALAMEVYAYQAKDPALITEATEIRMRATRRIGELMADQKAAGKMAKGTKGQKLKAGPGRGKKVKTGGGKKPPPVSDEVTLEKQGVDKDLAKLARKLAASPAKEFEQQVDRAIALATASASGDESVIKQARADRQAEKKQKRTVRHKKLAAKIKNLPEKKYGVILADPGWFFETYSEDTGEDRAAGNHYTVEETADIRKWPVQSIAADDCVLYMWGTVPMLEDALDTMRAWDFSYVSHFCWDKEVAGTGYWNRGEHELLLIGTRGKVVPPAQGDQFSSMIVERKTAHSVKPQKAYEIIEAYHPDMPKIEINRRGAPRDGWDGWGNEFKAPEPAAPEPKPVDPEERLFDATFGKPEAAE